MIDLLAVVAELIQEAGLGEIGIDLFIGTMPAEAHTAIMLRIPMHGSPVDDGSFNFFNTNFQVIVRDPRPELGYVRCQNIVQALRVNRVMRGSVSISWMHPQTLPMSYPRGLSEEVETSVRISVGYGSIV